MVKRLKKPFGEPDRFPALIVPQTEKVCGKPPAFKGITGDRKKVVTVRKALIRNFTCTTFFANFGVCSCYCRPNTSLHKRLVIFF